MLSRGRPPNVLVHEELVRVEGGSLQVRTLPQTLGQVVRQRDAKEGWGPNLQETGLAGQIQYTTDLLRIVKPRGLAS